MEAAIGDYLTIHILPEDAVEDEEPEVDLTCEVTSCAICTLTLFGTAARVSWLYCENNFPDIRGRVIPTSLSDVLSPGFAFLVVSVSSIALMSFISYRAMRQIPG